MDAQPIMDSPSIIQDMVSQPSLQNVGGRWVSLMSISAPDIDTGRKNVLEAEGRLALEKGLPAPHIASESYSHGIYVAHLEFSPPSSISPPSWVLIIPVWDDGTSYQWDRNPWSNALLVPSMGKTRLVGILGDADDHDAVKMSDLKAWMEEDSPPPFPGVNYLLHRYRADTMAVMIASRNKVEVLLWNQQGFLGKQSSDDIVDGDIPHMKALAIDELSHFWNDSTTRDKETNNNNESSSAMDRGISATLQAGDISGKMLSFHLMVEGMDEDDMEDLLADLHNMPLMTITSMEKKDNGILLGGKWQGSDIQLSAALKDIPTLRNAWKK